MSILNFRDNIKQIRESIEVTESGLLSGINELDSWLLGFSPSELITIGGRPGSGKSSLARNILLSLSNPSTNKGVGILYTLEMSCFEVAELILANLAKVDYNAIKRGNITEDESSRLDNASAQLSNYNILINDDSYVTPESIRDFLKQVKQSEPIACLLVDYLQLMSLRKNVESRQIEVAEISRELKAIAKDFEIPVIAFSQLNRNLEYRESSRPRMIDLRESGAMENDSSKIILIHRPSQYDIAIDSNAEDTGEVELVICKNRKGRIGIVKCGWISEYMSFENIPEQF